MEIVHNIFEVSEITKKIPKYVKNFRLQNPKFDCSEKYDKLGRLGGKGPSLAESGEIYCGSETN